MASPAGDNRIVRRLPRDRGTLAALCLFALIVLACAAAPLYAAHVSGTDPFRSTVNGTVALGGRDVEVVQENPGGLGATPIGPTWRGAYLLGADMQGRDVAARVLYGGRTSLLIAGGATALCLLLAAGLGTAAGFLGGAVDVVLAWLLDLLWAFPVYLLAVSLSIVLLSQDVRLGPFTLSSDSPALPVLILGLVFVPYAARPVRAQVIALRRAEFVEAAVALGGTPGHILRRHVLPHVLPTLVLFAPVLMAMTLLTEAALSALSIGVQPPGTSWGTLIADGQTLLYARPLVAIVPGVAVVLAVLSLNVLGEAARDALDPRARDSRGRG